MSELFAGIDLGGTNIAAALAGAGGTIVESASEPTRSHEGPDAVVARMARLVERLAARAGRPAALGVGVPGLIDFATGSTLFLPNFPTQWRGVPVASTLRTAIGCPVYLLNDCRTAALGELVFGRGRNVQDLVLFMLGTGIGGGVILDGKVRLGPLAAAGELGHQTILPDGPLCGCGNAGCLEALASGPAITAEGVRLLRSGLAPRLFAIVEGDAARVNPQTMAEAAGSGDTTVEAAIRRAAGFLGIGVANMITALHPQLVVLGGGVAAIGDLLFDTVRSVVRARVKMFPPDGVAIEPSALGDEAGVYGAIALAMRQGRI